MGNKQYAIVSREIPQRTKNSLNLGISRKRLIIDQNITV